MPAPQRLDRIVYGYRIGDPNGEFPIYDATGSTLYPGRWNTADAPVIYASENYSTALLEKLAMGNGRVPPNQHYVKLAFPKGLSFEAVTKDRLPGWDSQDQAAAKTFGAAWVRELRSAIMFVPSYVARVERNIVINPAHPEFPDIEVGLPEPVWWDARLF